MMNKKNVVKATGIAAAVVIAASGTVHAINAAPSYSAVEVKKSVIEGSVKESGKIHGADDKVYYAAVTAPIESISVKLGDKVKKGDTVVKYDDSELKHMLDEAEIKSNMAELEYKGSVEKSNDYAQKYQKAVNDDDAYAALYWLYREKGNEISEEEFNRIYQIQCQIDSVNKEIAEKEKEISESQHKKNKATGYGTKSEDDYSESNVKNIKDAQKDIDRLNTELAELKKQLNVTSEGAVTPDENSEMNDVNNVMEDITRNWTEAKSNKAAYEGNILKEDEKKALEKNSELTKKEAEQVSEDYVKATDGIKSEFSGIVTELNVHDGAYVTEGTPLFTVENSENLVCRVDISKYDILDIKEGQEAEVDISGRKYSGTVTKINSLAKADSSDKTNVEVEVSIDGADEAAIIGLEADVTIYTEKSENTLTVPVEAFYSDNDGDYCYVISNGKIEKKYVKSGINNGENVEITEGLESGDIVITDAVTDKNVGEKAKYVLN